MGGKIKRADLNSTSNFVSVDEARLVAPSGYVNQEKLEIAIKNIQSLGLTVEYREDILSKHLFFAGTVNRRVDELNWAFSGDNKYVFCVRGGYSSIELCKFLDFNTLDRDKYFIGFSDITSLHCAFLNKTKKVKLIHSKTAGRDDFLSNSYFDQFKKCLAGENYIVCLSSEQILDNPADFEGNIVGGNLTLFCSTLGTPFEVETKGKIIFLEAVEMSPWYIHNMLSHLLVAGKFQGAKAVIFGKMTGTKNYLDCLKTFVKMYLKVPVIYELDIGHDKNMIPIKLNSFVKFSLEKRQLKFCPEEAGK